MEAGPSGLQDRPETKDVGHTEIQSAQVGGGEEPYRIEQSGVRRFSKTKVTETTFNVRFNDQWQGRRLDDLNQQLYRLFENLLARAREGVADNDLLRVVLRHEALNRAIVIPLQEAADMNVEKIMTKVENVLQSEETLSMDNTFQGLFRLIRS